MVVRRTTAEWAQLVEDYKMSGQTMTAWCKGTGINTKTLGAHVRGRGREKKTRNAEEWIVLIEQQKASGINRAAWCQEHGINAHSMATAESRLKTPETPPASEKLEWVELSPTGTQKDEAEFHKNAERAQRRETEERSGPEKLSEKKGPDFGIRIRGGNLEMEAGAGYPVEKLAYLIERLAQKC